MKFYQIGFVWAAVFWEDRGNKNMATTAFRICFENSSINSLRHAANSVFDKKLKGYKFP